MRKRFWAAVVVGAAVGGGVVAGFGPYVEGEVGRRAAAYGASVRVGSVVPSLVGLRLRGVVVTVAALPGVWVRLDEVLVGWGSGAPVVVGGGRVRAVGPAADLVERVEQWGARYPDVAAQGGRGAGPRALRLRDLEFDWKERLDGAGGSLHASGVGLVRAGGDLEIEARSVRGELGRAAFGTEQVRLALGPGKRGYGVRELRAGALTVEVRAGSGGAAPVDLGSAPEHWRVRAVRSLRRALVAAARRIDTILLPEASVGVAGVRAVVRWADQALALGPGTLGVTRAPGALRIELAPVPEALSTGGAAGEERTLTFSVQVPLGEGAQELVAELRGGPVWLSALGVRDGDLGLRDVGTTSLESEATVVLAPDAASVRVDGRGKLRGLSLQSASLASAPLQGIELAWRAVAEAALDGSFVRVREGEVDLGDLRLLVRGSFAARGGAYQVSADFELPLVTCQRAFDSLPQALVPELRGLRFVGSLAARGFVRFDTARLERDYAVDWDGALGCRVVDVPAGLQVARFRRPFRRFVYTPEGEETQMQLGPQTADWVPYGAISRFMEGAVLTTEDGRFHRHHGFDPEAIVNSIRENLRAGQFVRGASTISMQLAKNLYLRRTKTLSRKLQELVLTMYLEQELTKREIMELYLNVIEFGPMAYGIGPAARHYFNTSASELSLGQALYLASILPNPKKQHFGAGGAVSASWSQHLRRLMHIVHKIKRISDEELATGLRETVVLGAARPSLAPPAEPYGDEGAGGSAPEQPAP